MNPVLLGYLRLMRPANLPTAAADIMAGVAISGISMQTYFITADGIRLWPSVFYLTLASVFLYAGGVVLNDVFDAELDTKERPERPIPSGLVSVRSAAIFGGVLILIGIMLAFLLNDLTGKIAMVLAASILLYDGFAKNFSFLGPLSMGVCRALNLILGMSINGEVEYYYYGFIPLVYIFAITLISRGEVHGANKNHLILAAFLYAVVIFAVLYLIPSETRNLMNTIPYHQLENPAAIAASRITIDKTPAITAFLIFSGL